MGMMKSIASAMLTSVMSFAWDVIKVGERIVALEESCEQARPFAHRAGRVVTRAGEWLELSINSFAIRLGYGDGEVSGLVAWGPRCLLIGT
jgi:hypothetical protein